jgi:multisite-specific tRNA:(cytosine-C5)-methyltransferase
MSRSKKRAPGGGGGKNWGKGGKRKAPSGQGGQANQQQQQQKGNDGWSSLDMNNKRFEAYYMDQEIVPRDEWEAFMDAFRQSLPTTFRFTAGKATTRQLITQMQERFVPELSGIEFEGEPVKPPQALSWYPEGLAWQVDVRKSVLRKQPDFQNFQKFLVNETAVVSVGAAIIVGPRRFH